MTDLMPLLLLALGVVGIVGFIGLLVRTRKKRLLTGRKAEEKRRLDEKSGVTRPTPATTSTSTEGGPGYGVLLLGLWRWTYRLLLLVLLAVIVRHLWKNGISAPTGDWGLSDWVPKRVWHPGEMFAWAWPNALVIVGVSLVAMAVFWLGGKVKFLDAKVMAALHALVIWTVIILIGGGALMAFGTWMSGGSSTTATLNQLTMPPLGTTSVLPTKPGYAVSFDGSGFEAHCLYRDGTEGIVGDPTRPCHNGPMRGVYARDTSGKSNTVTYRYVR